MKKGSRLRKRFRPSENENEEYEPLTNSMDDFIVPDDESGNYFTLDSQPIQFRLTDHLANLIDLPKSQIQRAVFDSFKEVGEDCISDYMGAKPSDQGWKLTCDSKKIGEIEKELQSLRSEMEAEKPTIGKIYDAAMTREERKKCLRLLDQMNNTEPYTSDYYKLQDQLNILIEKSKQYTKAEIAELEREETVLKTMTGQTNDLKNRILKLDAPTDIKAKLYQQYQEMNLYETGSSLYCSLQEEIEWALKLPYDKKIEHSLFKKRKKETNRDVNKYFVEMKRKMDKYLYGMENVKEQLIHILNDRRTSGDKCNRNIALVGPPGVGKTEIGKVLAKVTGYKFKKISAGAMDSSLIKGSGKVWQGSEPSIVLQILAEMGTKSGIILWDEVDKLGNTEQGKMAQHALLHVSDYSNNQAFEDNYLKNFSHDISEVLHIFCMNTEEFLDSAFRDRLYIIYLSDYSFDEKVVIFRDYMLPKALKTVKIDSRKVSIDKSAIEFVIKSLNSDSLRSIEKIIKAIVGRINMYKSTILPDGTVGNLQLSYKIPNFKFPLKITLSMIKELVAGLC